MRRFLIVEPRCGGLDRRHHTKVILELGGIHPHLAFALGIVEQHGQIDLPTRHEIRKRPAPNVRQKRSIGHIQKSVVGGFDHSLCIGKDNPVGSVLV